MHGKSLNSFRKYKFRLSASFLTFNISKGLNKSFSRPQNIRVGRVTRNKIFIFFALGVSIEEVQCNLQFPSALPRGVTVVNIYVVDPPLNLTLMVDNFCSYFV